MGHICKHPIYIRLIGKYIDQIDRIAIEAACLWQFRGDVRLSLPHPVVDEINIDLLLLHEGHRQLHFIKPAQSALHILLRNGTCVYQLFFFVQTDLTVQKHMPVKGKLCHAQLLKLQQMPSGAGENFHAASP